MRLRGSVWILKAAPAVPRYHFWGRPDHTACGVRLAYAVALPERHARKFAKPCERCMHTPAAR